MGTTVAAMGTTVARRAAGWLWLSLWVAALAAIHAPWRDLGGLTAERLRWLDAAGLLVGVPAGVLVGAWARERCLADPRRTHASVLRFLLSPALAATAIVAGTLQSLGSPDAASVVIGGTLAYWAGLDAGFAAWPLTHGRGYRFAGPLPPDPHAAPGSGERPAGRRSHW